MNDLAATLKQRFPLLTSLRLSHGSGGTEDLASFMGLLLAAIEKSRYSSFCFVLPRSEGIAPLTTVLYSLGKFAVDFPNLAEKYARKTFEEGTRVQVNPAGKIFVFGGLWDGAETHFRLKIINEERSSFTWPVTEILRIEPTKRKIPRGRLTDAGNLWKAAAPSPLDLLIGTRTFGNTSLFENHVLYVGSRAEFDDFLRGTLLTAPGCVSPTAIDDLVSIGIVEDSGTIRHEDAYKVTGQPFIAISSRIEHIAAACRTVPPRSKVVIVDGARRIRNLAAFDEIVETQGIVVVADAHEEGQLGLLFDRGCKFWRLSLRDLEIGGAIGAGKLFGPLMKAARNQAVFKTEVMPCENAALDQLSADISACSDVLEESEGDETWRVLGALRMELACYANMIAPSRTEDLAHRIRKAESIREAAESRLMWLPDNASKPLIAACAALNTVARDSSLGSAKGDALAELIGILIQQRQGRVAVVVRSPTQKEPVSEWLRNRGMGWPVLSMAGIERHGFYDTLVCIAWSNFDRFNRLVDMCIAPVVYVLAYSFERNWLERFHRRRVVYERERVRNIGSGEKFAVTGIGEEGSEPWAEEQKPAPQSLADQEVRKWNTEELIAHPGTPRMAEPGEETVAARAVSFVGQAFAFITERYRLPVVTDVVTGNAGDNFKIPRRRIDAIRVNDFIVFRDGGRRDVIHAMADAQLGSKAAEIREVASRWHKALRASGLSEDALMKELVGVKCSRSLPTVKYWLSDESIGPQHKPDLEAIAYALGDDKLLQQADIIWEAIRTLRSEHLSAGMRLAQVLMAKLPSELGKVRDGGTRIEIDNAVSACVVEVEHIANQVKPCPRSQANSLIWEHGEFS